MSERESEAREEIDAYRAEAAFCDKPTSVPALIHAALEELCVARYAALQAGTWRLQDIAVINCDEVRIDVTASGGSEFRLERKQQQCGGDPISFLGPAGAALAVNHAVKHDPELILGVLRHIELLADPEYPEKRRA